MALEVAGMTLPDTVDVAGRTLHINGAGLRTRFFLEVYVIGLYMPRTTRSAAAVLAVDGPRRLVLHIRRALDGRQIADAIADGFARNASDALPRLRERLERLQGMFP